VTFSKHARPFTKLSADLTVYLEEQKLKIFGNRPALSIERVGLSKRRMLGEALRRQELHTGLIDCERIPDAFSVVTLQS
jgi:hypothetical protein